MVHQLGFRFIVIITSVGLIEFRFPIALRAHQCNNLLGTTLSGRHAPLIILIFLLWMRGGGGANLCGESGLDQNIKSLQSTSQ